MFTARGGTTWLSEPTDDFACIIQRANPLVSKARLLSVSDLSPIQTWSRIFDDAMLNEMVLHTNEKMEEFNKKYITRNFR